MKRLFRVSVMVAVTTVVLATLPPQRGMRASTGSLPDVQLNVQNAGPRQVEDTTQRAVARDYTAAWQALAEALSQNRTELLAANFVGTASQKLGDTVREQRKAGLHQRITDKGHHVDAIFYSPEGSAIELHDTATLQIQVLDGDKVVHSEDATVPYVALLTAAENSWKVRVLEAVPAF